MPFRFTSNRVHLTYRSHLPFTELEELIQDQTKRAFKHVSYVHEASDQETPYEHTHVLIWFKSKLDTKNERIFDFKDVHPNIKAVRTDEHWDRTWQYHEKDPLLLRPEDHTNPRMNNGDLQRRIKKARTLYDACIDAGIDIKTVQDIKAIRMDKAIVEDVPPPFAVDAFNRESLTIGRSIILHGKSGTGKTCFAMAHFTQPLVVSHIDDLKRFNQDIHDGIIFDDMGFTHWPRESCIHLLDYDFPRSINVKHSVVTIPAKTAKIFCHNYDDAMGIFPAEHRADTALVRRVRYRVFVENNLFDTTPPPPTTPTDKSIWHNGQLIRDQEGEPTEAVPFHLRDVGIFKSGIQGDPVPSQGSLHLECDEDIFKFDL